MTESSFQGQAGTIHTRSWELDRARGEVVLVHGYGEHLGRYEHVAKALNDAGWSAQLHPGELAALVLSGPVIGTLKGITSLLGMDVIPSDPIPPSVLSRDEEIGRAYDEDPLVWHGPFKRQTLLGIAELLTELAIDADKVTGPVLWLHGEEDQLVPMAGSRRGIALLRKAEVTEKIYPGARHEIFNELNKDEVLADTTAFLAKVTDG
jgi:alpha-beta hydrolase superfamily lysophospholipase